MKAIKIKINELNKDVIEAELKEINGRSYNHSYTNYSEIENIAIKANKSLYNLLGNKSMMKGATITSLSGGSVANSYRYSRKMTFIKLQCYGYGEWRLIQATSDKYYGSGGISPLCLTKIQDTRAVDFFRKKYTISL